MKRLSALVALFLLIASSALAGVDWLPRQQFFAGGKSTVIYSAVVTSDGSGDASGSTPIHGYIVRVVTNPDVAPTDDYDCYLYDVDGVDVLGTALLNRDTTTSEEAFPLAPDGSIVYVRVDGDMTLTCAAMGETKSTLVKIYVVE